MSSVALTWTPADTVGGPRIEQYAVYRAAGESDFGLLNTQAVIYSDTFEDAVIPFNYSDDALLSGVTYHYYVVALDCYNRELRSNTLTFTAATIALPSTPVLGGFSSAGANKIDWRAVTAGALAVAGYRLYVNSVLLIDTADPNVLDYVHSLSSPNEGEYIYYVVAYDTVGNVSANSNLLDLFQFNGDIQTDVLDAGNIGFAVNDGTDQSVGTGGFFDGFLDNLSGSLFPSLDGFFTNDGSNTLSIDVRADADVGVNFFSRVRVSNDGSTIVTDLLAANATTQLHTGTSFHVRRWTWPITQSEQHLVQLSQYFILFDP